MIGVDTNILLRAVLDDDPIQSEFAKDFLKKASQQKQLFISGFAILEMAWVLKMKKKSRRQISESILDLVDSPGLVIGNREVIIKAVEKYTHGKADFGDYMIFSEGEIFGSKQMVSFDQKLYSENKAIHHPKEFFI